MGTVPRAALVPRLPRALIFGPCRTFRFAVMTSRENGMP
jgi:hypothetical protein